MKLKIVLKANTIFNNGIFSLFICFSFLKAIVVIDPSGEQIIDCRKILHISSTFDVLLTGLFNSEKLFCLIIMFLLFLLFLTLENLIHDLVVAVCFIDTLLKIVFLSKLSGFIGLDKILNID